MRSRRKASRYLIGMNKGGHDAAACLIELKAKGAHIELFLKERLIRRKKAAGTIEVPLLGVKKRIGAAPALLAENSSLMGTAEFERRLAAEIPLFRDSVRRYKLQRFHREWNPKIEELTHHYCHAMAAASIAPFRKSLIVVVDGAGNTADAFADDHPELVAFPPPPGSSRGVANAAEYITVYLADGANLRCVEKHWQVLGAVESPRKRHTFGSRGIGLLFTAASRFIFGEIHQEGKVMGLAPFGKPVAIRDALEYARGWDWERKTFRGKTKQAWERAPSMRQYRDIAASVQAHFETVYLSLVRSLKQRFPEVQNLILSGGCALNCVTNMKIVESGLFKHVYVPPFPSDEGIAFGAAAHLRFKVARQRWTPVSWKAQQADFGPMSSVPTPSKIRSVFRGCSVTRPKNLADEAARLLANGKVIGWYQGRSESGPRALGSRSILASPSVKGMKDHLNARVKGRESFRPYGGSCLWEKAHEYFDVEKGFESPFMSFAPIVRKAHRGRLSEIMHVDGTSRIQTVHKEQNPLFHALIREFGKRTGVYCVLNTSMNVMGEPIVETIEDARRFFESTPVDAIVVGDYLVQR